MRIQNLGPHTFISEQPHPRHRHWLKCFTPRERHRLIDEDCHARMEVFGIIAGAMAFGLAMLVVVLLFAL